ncbi:MAG: carbamoyl-phosphate synthase large subunit [Desulfarculales bacterium]|jgi:carbamoyl-phosphate synthase large subunit|nr:carbamoyl-phosphate synthase large subunit [Desulfarculales bacterium]
MPKRQDLNTIMLLGSGPIVIGQACEFDYSGTQACRALKEEGCRIILLNSNPATIMTDPGYSDRTYIEPLTVEMAAAVIAQERPDALLPTLGGQTALNLAMELYHAGVLAEFEVKMIGAPPEAIELAENRQAFRQAMLGIGLDLPLGGLATSEAEALAMLSRLRFPLIIRPSYTLGGKGGGVAYNREEFSDLVSKGLSASPTGQVLIEESVLGWKEMELEVMRDNSDNAVVVCGIENLDPMGIHTGDSITVSPIQTLAEPEYQAMREDALAVVRRVGVDTGGCNIQFAINPLSGRRVIVEMNPRVSRSSALASKATGYPIARVAAKLALGYRLDELKNDITGTSACFEPALDYCVVKIPRFDFEKFTGASEVLGMSMHAVGETMALGGNFREALQKALRGLETGLSGLMAQPGEVQENGYLSSPGQRLNELIPLLQKPGPGRILHLYEAVKLGLSLDEAGRHTGIDPWFLLQIEQIVQCEQLIADELPSLLAASGAGISASARKLARYIKAQGFSDRQISNIVSETALPIREEDIRSFRMRAGIFPVYRGVDTCAGEFAALTPYFYSTYDALSPDSAPGEALNSQTQSSPLPPARKKRVVILGGGPNRIGQGIEFDYCCVQAARYLREMGLTAIMINSNPETVSTDFDSVDRLYFEPVTAEDVLAICALEKPDGIIVQFGGQTPLNLARDLEKAGLSVWGTSPASIARAEDRDEFNRLAASLGIPQPQSGMGYNLESACRIAQEIGYPVMVRPSFVLGGRAMGVMHDEHSLRDYVTGKVTGSSLKSDAPILIDKFLEDAVEVDVDALSDGTSVTVAAIMEHIEQAGVHSGDSCCSIPTHTLSALTLDTIREYTGQLGIALHVKGLLNIQFAVQRGVVHVLEVNPRASRTVPFVSKTIGCSLAGMAVKIMAGMNLDDLDFKREPVIDYCAVKEAVLPFERFPGALIGLGPEMRSTGEVMGIDLNFGLAFLKAQAAAGTPIPYEGGIILSVSDRDKNALAPLAAELKKLGFSLYATPGTGQTLTEAGIDSQTVSKIGARPNLLDIMRDGKAGMIVNTVSNPQSVHDASKIREEALRLDVTLLTTIPALRAVVEGLSVSGQWAVSPLQDYYTGKVRAKTKTP